MHTENGQPWDRLLQSRGQTVTNLRTPRAYLNTVPKVHRSAFTSELMREKFRRLELARGLQ
jgi:hypothetical protein